ncbi:M23 family metallopeptidase [Pseudomonas sp.]|uniref:M23 family metallopeptidase n=1 Tax=Pseudomonas sp. TaxID=306 RepID=UPI003BB5B5C9
MKSILIFVVGALVGVAGLFYVLQGERLTSPVALVASAVEPVQYRAEPLPPALLAAVEDAMPLHIPASNNEGAMPADEPLVQQPITSEAIAPELSPVADPLESGDSADIPAEALPAHPGDLLIPVAGIASTQLQDTFHDMRGTERRHEAIDIMAPLKTPVFAVDDGILVKLFDSKPGGLTLYQFDASATFAYYYSHLDGYAAGLVEGQVIKRGDLIGYVGATGNANPLAPHLHFAVFLLGPEKQWWKGTAINPYPLFQR